MYLRWAQPPARCLATCVFSLCGCLRTDSSRCVPAKSASRPEFSRSFVAFGVGANSRCFVTCVARKCLVLQAVVQATWDNESDFCPTESSFQKVFQRDTIATKPTPTVQPPSPHSWTGPTDDLGNTTTIDWFYDELGRLTEEHYDAPFGTANDFIAKYSYDLASNRV